MSGARDHYRDQAQSSGVSIERVPQYSNFFSELKNFPSHTFMCAPPPPPPLPPPPTPRLHDARARAGGTAAPGAPVPSPRAAARAGTDPEVPSSLFGPAG